MTHELTFVEEDRHGYGDGLDDRWNCTCGMAFGIRDVETAFEHGLSVSRETSWQDALSTGQKMVIRTIEIKKVDWEISAPMPTLGEIDFAIDSANSGTALGEYIGAAWEAAEEIVYDKFPQFREPYDPIDHYGTPEHEAWLIEKERQEG